MSTKIHRTGGLQLFDRGISVNSKITAEDLKREAKLEEHAHVLDRYLEENGGDGTYGWQGVLSRGGNLTVPKASIKDKISGAERVSRVRERMNRGEPPLLISYDTATETPIFAEEDMEAYEDGYICPGCLQYQAVPNSPVCVWLRPNDGTHVPDVDKGCGHRLNIR